MKRINQKYNGAALTSNSSIKNDNGTALESSVLEQSIYKEHSRDINIQNRLKTI